MQDLPTSYIITGVLPSGRRFPPIHCINLHWALAINVWRGTLWACKAGKRRRVYTWKN